MAQLDCLTRYVDANIVVGLKIPDQMISGVEPATTVIKDTVMRFEPMRQQVRKSIRDFSKVAIGDIAATP